MADPFPAYPAEIKASTEHPELKYVRAPQYFTVYGHPPSGISTEATFSGSEGEIAICRGEAGDAGHAAKQSETAPAYVLEAVGPLSAPSGLIFIRLEEGVRVTDRRRDIASVGYDVFKLVPQAPNAAWLTASSRRVADALEGIGRLERIPNVVNVEPQMLSERKHREARGGTPAQPAPRRS